METMSLKKKLGALVILAASLSVGACEPMTEEELAAYQQRQAQLQEQRRQEAAQRARYCEGNISCQETQQLVARQCEALVRRRHEYRRVDVYGNAVYSELLSPPTAYFESGPLHYAGFGDNHRFRMYFNVRRSSLGLPGRMTFVRYDASCIIRKNTTQIINIDYKVL